jgi:hypothetical protein
MFVDSVWDGVAHRFPNATATELRQRVNDMWKALPAEERAGLIKKYLGQKVPFFFFSSGYQITYVLICSAFFLLYRLLLPHVKLRLGIVDYR